MSKQIVLKPSPQQEELVCTKCKHFIQLEDSYYCSLLAAYLSEQTLSIPCDFQENTQNST
jgi:hypothetical protein